jgi:peptide/nickel transport system substrate-binding protein
MMGRGRSAGAGAGVFAVALVFWAAGTASGNLTQVSTSGGTLRTGIPSTPDHLDPALSYTNEGWEILEATGNGLLTFKKAAGGPGAEIVPDIASALPTITNQGRTYTFHLRSGVRFSPPVNRTVRPSDFKYTIERLFLVNSGGVGFYTGIAGTSKFAKTKKGGISGIFADDKKMTIAFHLTEPDGTFLDYMAVPFAFVVPAGTPAKDVSTIPRWRVATGPYEISKYVPKQEALLIRNPSFHQWTANSPNGHLDKIDVRIGITPEQSVNEIANGQLDWYFESVPPDRLSQLKAKYPRQVQLFTRNNITYFSMNERKFPFNKVAVRQAVNYATDRRALVKIFGGQGTPSENMIPPAFGSAYKKHTLYPYDLAHARKLIAQAGVKGASVTVWGHTTDPAPKAVQYMASVLDSIGLKASVKTLDESVYWDTIATEKGDPPIAFNDWNQDFPEGQDFIDVLANGEHISAVGNNNQSNLNVAGYNKLIDRARRMPLGTPRNAIWAKLDYLVTKNNAPWVVFMNRQWPKFVAPHLSGLVFNGTYFELFPSMYFTK